MVADKREFVRLDVGYLDNPKIADALDASPLAVLAHVASMTHCRQHRTDGVFVVRRILRKVGAEAADARLLLDLGLWVDLGEGKAELHDYLKHQESAAQIARLSEAGKKGAAGRWAEKRNTDRTPNRNADRYAEERRGEERRKEATASSGRDADRIADEPPPDFDQPEFDAKKLLASAGLAQSEVRDFLVDLKAGPKPIRNTTALINSLHRDGKLPGRIQEWRQERDLATEAAAKPKVSTTTNRVREGIDLAVRLAAQEAADELPDNVHPFRQITEGA
jgi:hypothetical protein